MGRHLRAAVLVLALIGTSDVCVAQGTLFDAYHEAGQRAFNVGNWESAKKHFTSALRAAEQVWGAQGNNTLICHWNLGLCNLRQGNNEEAEKEFETVYQATKKYQNDKQRDQALEAVVMMNQARLNQKHAKDTLPTLKWGLIIQDQGRKDDEIAVNLAKLLGNAEFQLEHYQDALPSYQRAYRVSEKVLGAMNSTTLWLRNRVAWTKFQGKDYEGSEKAYRELIKDLEAASKRDVTALAEAYVDLSLVMKSQKKLQDAEQCAEKGLALYESLADEDDSVVFTLRRLASIEYDQKHYELGDARHRSAVKLLEKSKNPKPLEICTSLNSLGWSLSLQKKFDEAEEILRRDVEIRREKEGDDHENLAYPLSLLASVLANQKKYDEAEQAYRQVLKIRKKSADASQIAEAVTELAGLYEKQGRPEDAEKELTSALREQEAVVGKNSEKLAHLMRSIAFFYTRLGKHDRAEDLFKQALANRERGLPPDHLDIAESLEDLGDFYEPLSRYADAEIMHSRALAIRKKKLGNSDYKTARSELDLAWVLQRLARYNESLPLAQHGLSIVETTQGKDSDAASHACNVLASALKALDKLTEAEGLFKRALEIDERVGDRYGASIITNNLGLLYRKLGRLADARSMFERSIEHQEADRQLNSNSKSVNRQLLHLANLTRSYENLGSVCFVLGELAASQEFYEKGLELAEKELAPEHALVAAGIMGLAHIKKANGELADAEALMKRSNEIIEKTQGAESVEMAEELHSLSQLRSSQGRLNEARSLLEQVAATYRRAAQPETIIVSPLDDLAEVEIELGLWNNADKHLAEFNRVWEKEGVYHPSIIYSLVYSAKLRCFQGRFADADGLIHRAKEIIVRSYGNDDLRIAWIETENAALLLAAGKFDEARAAVDVAVAINSKVYGAGHYQTAWKLLTLSRIQSRMGRYPEALEALQGARRAVADKLASDHYFYSEALLCQAEILLAENNQDEARAVCEQSLALANTVFGPDSYQAAEKLNKLAAILAASSELDAAERHARRALLIRESIFGKDSYLVAETTHQLAKIALKQRNFDEAEKLLNRSLQLRERVFPAGHQDIIQAAKGLESVYDAAGNLDRLEELRSKYKLTSAGGH